MSVTSHPSLPEFDYVLPASLAEASRFLADHAGEARPFLGGTDTFVRMRDGVWKVKYLVDVKPLEGMRSTTFDPSIGLKIGAGVTMNRVITHPVVRHIYPLLAEAAHTVASYSLRTRATIVGNICNASPAGDSVGACLAFDARLTVHGVDGYREERLRTFFLGPGRSALRPGDIVTAITLPMPPDGAAGRYIKLGRNTLGDLAIVGVTVLGHPDASAASGYRFHIALASVAPVPLMPAEAEAILAEGPVTPAALERAAAAAMEACSPIDDVRSGARYRRLMVRNLTLRALEAVWAQIGPQ